MKMKHHLTALCALAILTFAARADLAIPGDGSDGALNITEDTVIDLSQAVTGTWNQNNTANAGKGVYDPDKWAIVFKYTSVNIAGHTTGAPAVLDGRTLKFKNHPSHAPVVWLVQGNVTIDGILNLNGQNGLMTLPEALIPIEAGPGGFRGGPGSPQGHGAGYGPGGSNAHWTGPSGQYAGTYGNPQIIPLIGGSGSGGTNEGVASGAGGGGAILIATPGTVSIGGSISAKGGYSPSNNAAGSGGAVRVIAASVAGAGSIYATGPTGAGSIGRIRLETNSLTTSLVTLPETIGVPPANSPIIWPATNAPKARVVSVDAISAPVDPRSPLIAAADVAIQNNAPVNILIETRDFPIEGVVQLAVIPKFGNRSWFTATRIGGDINVATWQVTTVLPQGFVTLQARATQP